MYDALIIGSGIGSLTTADLLAQTAGLRVLVLEKHSTPGGLTHSFRAMGASWDVGLHYVGDMEPGSRPRQLLDYLTGGALSWTRMPTGYDRFYLPGHGLDVTIPSGLQAYRRLLTSLFPREKRAIRRYCADVQRTYSWMSLGYVREMVPPRAAPAVRLAQRALAGCALELTEHYMERRFHDPALRALLTTHWGDYGVEPARSAFVAHAMIVCHYMNGAWFPSGGSGQIARMIEEGIVEAGGQIRLAQDVEEILVEDGTAVGVRVTDRSGPTPVSYEERAPIIISGIGARETYTRLLPATGPTAALTARVRERIARLGRGASAVTLYLTLDHYPNGVDGSNVWINTATGRADPARMSADLLGGHPHSAFISFPGIKSGDTHATAEIVSFAQPEAFQRWAGTRPGMRGEDYERLTSAMARGLIDLADTAVPGLKDAVRYAEVGTPLTIEHFTSHSLGCFYGLPLTPERFRADLATPSTPITGLFLTGQDAGMPGIVGAALAGMSAACKVLGPSGIRASTGRCERRVPSEPTPNTLRGSRLSAAPERGAIEQQCSAPAGSPQQSATSHSSSHRMEPGMRVSTRSCGLPLSSGDPIRLPPRPGKPCACSWTCAPRGMVRRGHATHKAATRWILNSRTGTSSTTRQQEARTRTLPQPAAAYSSLLEQVSHRSSRNSSRAYEQMTSSSSVWQPRATT